MCGLVGFISKDKWYQPKKQSVLSLLLYADTVRGMDSTGVYFVAEQGNVLYKRALSGYDFINTRAFLSLFSKLSPHAVLGHNRAATHGAVTDDNAHPFKNGKIVLTHNGVVSGYPIAKYDVDSKWLADILNTTGVEGLKEVTGSYALVWHDSTTGHIHFIRNSARAFFFAVCTEIDTIFYASEKHMLEWVLVREQVKFDSIQEVLPSTLYTISTKDLSITLMEVSLEEEKKQNINQWQDRLYKYKDHLNEKEPSRVPMHNQQRTPASVCKVTDLRTNESSLSMLGIKEGDLLDVEVDDIDTKLNVALLTLVTVPEALKDHTISIRYVYDPEEEAAIYSYVGETITVKIERAKCYYAFKRLFLYASEIVKAPDHSTGEVLSYEDMESMSEGKVGSAALLELPCIPGPNKSLISVGEFGRLTKFGCSCCQANIEEADVYSMSWFNSNSPICPECTLTFMKEAK